MAITSRVVRKTYIDVPTSVRGPLTVKVGFPAGKASSANIDKAIWNEFGTRGGGWGGPIPERPFMRNSARNNQNKYMNAMKAMAKAIVMGKATLKQALTDLGQQAMQDIQREITALKSPPNSPVTIALKGSSNPLIDSAEMRNSVTYKVE